MIEGISHITFIVSDLDRMSEMLKIVFDAEEIYSSDTREYSISKEKFFMVGTLWIAIMEGEPISERTYNHVAFKIADSELDDYLNRIRSLDLEISDGRSRYKEEGRSIYFYDYDNHLFELHTGTLNQRLGFYKQPEI